MEIEEWEALKNAQIAKFYRKTTYNQKEQVEKQTKKRLLN